MSSLNLSYAARIDALGFRFPELLLPSTSVNFEKWAVIACDQHTSDHEYWSSVKDIVGDAPSTLELIFPEVYLDDKNPDRRIASIHAAMEDYISRGLLTEEPASLLYVERRTSASGLRCGVLLAVDLERYDFSPDSTSLIRATEGTILERIPPRVRIRKGAPIELPHIMILIDDKSKALIESFQEKKAELRKKYEIELMLGGGSLAAWTVENPELLNGFIAGLEALASQEYAAKEFGTASPFLFAMGDGNHSLATAKTVWEEMKTEQIRRTGNWDALKNHPARFALAEIVNLHSPGLRFEPIHRVVFNAEAPGLLEILEKEYGVRITKTDESTAKRILETEARGQKAAAVRDGQTWMLLEFPEKESKLPNGLVDQAFESYRKNRPGAKIDFVHGWEHTKKAASGGVPFFFPVIARERLFPYVANPGPLPRKAFSMGDAEEKRYYVESRRIL